MRLPRRRIMIIKERLIGCKENRIEGNVEGLRKRRRNKLITIRKKMYKRK